MRTEPKASYRMVQYEYAYRYTPSMYVYIFFAVVGYVSIQCTISVWLVALAFYVQCLQYVLVQRCVFLSYSIFSAV